jgi:hypothetical protein
VVKDWFCQRIWHQIKGALPGLHTVCGLCASVTFGVGVEVRLTKTRLDCIQPKDENAEAPRCHVILKINIILEGRNPTRLFMFATLHPSKVLIILFNIAS